MQAMTFEEIFLGFLIALAAGCVGIIQGCVDACASYSKQRKQFGQPIADWLFDYCNMVTPGKFHDMSRHIRKIG